MRRFPSKYNKPDESPGYLLWVVSHSWQRMQSEALKPFKLTHAQFVLLAGVVWLDDKKQEITQSKLAEHAHTDPMMTSQVVRTLEKKGLIKRYSHPVDTRALILKPTKSGLEMVKKAVKEVEKVDAFFFEPVAGKEKQLLSLLQNLGNQ